MYSFLQLTLQTFKNCLNFVIITIIVRMFDCFFHLSWQRYTSSVCNKKKVYFLTVFLMSLLISFKPIKYFFQSKQWNFGAWKGFRIWFPFILRNFQHETVNKCPSIKNTGKWYNRYSMIFKSIFFLTFR